jgi:ribonuclease PH
MQADATLAASSSPQSIEIAALGNNGPLSCDAVHQLAALCRADAHRLPMQVQDNRLQNQRLIDLDLE